jgi:hypothetical protein
MFCERGLLWTEDEAAGPLYLETDGGVSEVRLGQGREETGSSPENGVVAALALPETLKAPLSLYVRSDLAFLESLATEKMPSPGLQPALEAHRLADLAYRSAAAAVTAATAARPPA